ncbi:hypothetical protein Tco_0401514 [Tanacetum coccineum]
MPSWTSSESRNPSKRFVTCSKCNVYDFLDDDLPSEYYKELLYGMFQKQKQSKKHMNYEQVINVLAMEKSRLEEELRATKSKLKLYDRCYGSNVQGKQPSNARCKCKMQMQDANATCKCKLQMQLVNASCKCLLANARCKCKLQMQVANASYKCKMQGEKSSNASYNWKLHL